MRTIKLNDEQVNKLKRIAKKAMLSQVEHNKKIGRWEKNIEKMLNLEEEGNLILSCTGDDEDVRISMTWMPSEKRPDDEYGLGETFYEYNWNR